MFTFTTFAVITLVAFTTSVLTCLGALSGYVYYLKRKQAKARERLQEPQMRYKAIQADVRFNSPEEVKAGLEELQHRMKAKR